ncbi:PulJ/GspJ family protein [Candidatus Rhodobacter oscarellae]|nr:prepilin-type N-terminal cleavage/methylation domain-containing protein [Candidatus Rhodobacter lobularis]
MRRRLDHGISLVEMVVAVLVLSIGIVAGFQGLNQARRGIGEELPRLMAQQAALNRAAQFQMLGVAGAGTGPTQTALGGIDWHITIETAPTEGGFVEARIRAQAEGHPGALVVVYAPSGPPEP